MKKIILAAGGTGGHFFAAIAVYDELIKQGFDPLIIADERCKNYQCGECKIQFIDFNYQGTSGFKKITLAIKTFLMIFTVRKILKKIKPDLIIGFGGYTSIPAILAGYILGITTSIHEQNLFLGKANKILSYFTDFVTLSFKEFLIKNKIKNKKYIFVGQVVRNKIANINREKKFNINEFKIFIFGGSQGAKSFTEILPKSIEIVTKNCLETKISITQQVSEIDKSKLEIFYSKLGLTYNLSNFFFDMIDIYNDTNLVISRSGASTIGELCKIGMPSILIPYPFAAEDHQLHNAMILQDKDAAICIEAKNLTAESLATKIIFLIQNPDKLKLMSSNLKSFSTNGAERIIDTVVKKLS